MNRFVIIALAGVMFLSCIGTESTMKLNENGSGNLVFQYRISQMFKSLGDSDGEGEKENEAPFPISKEEVEKSLKELEGVKINSVEEWEDEQDVYVKMDIDFTNVESLSKASMFENMPITLTTEGGRTVYTQLISKGDEPADPESVTAMESYFAGYELSMLITAPKQIIAHNRGELSNGSRTVKFSISMIDFMQINEKTELIISW
ncbi:MAG: hypothetical protein JW904_03340 [Spirochaetales bacterium]|nr:hypothetical protein [Spirochaetales bacterium]